MAILHHGKELSEEELKQAAGGYIFDNENLEYEWEVIDDKTGNVIRRGMARWEAEDFASSHGLSTKRLSWNELKRLRETGFVEPSWYSFEDYEEEY